MKTLHENETPGSPKWNPAQIERLIEELSGIRADMLRLEAEFADEIQQAHPSHRKSARNLLHYLTLRQHDIRPLQESLASLGLSRLGRAEAHILASVNAVLELLHHLAQRPFQLSAEHVPPVEFNEAGSLLETHIQSLPVTRHPERPVRIMVTMPSEAAEDHKMVRDLLASGMDSMRINCAHDDAGAWERMIANLRRAEKDVGKKCIVLMDLAGPKLRTGPIAPGPQVLKWRPQRDSFGRVTQPARIWLTPIGNSQAPPSGADACLPAPAEWLAELRAGDLIRFFDTRSAARSMQIVEKAGNSYWAESTQTSYVATGTKLSLLRSETLDANATLRQSTEIGELAPSAQELLLKKGDTLILTKALTPGKPAIYDDQGNLQEPATIGVTLPEIFSDVSPDERIWLDDGKIGGVIKSVKKDRINVEITQARKKGERLGADKGINLPDTKLRLPALTAKDLEDLPFIVANADVVGLSFVRRAKDVYELQSRLAQLGGERLGIVLKIETLKGFAQLPNLLLAAMRSASAGVMIARGDLAVECGYERLAEIQEEILWLCEAAHVPVIWATQVLEQLAKKGQPTRAEITDAAMAERAEAVMLNKGPYILEAVRVLDDILRRMQTHQRKKKAMLRKLKLAHIVKGD
jgi:pyruvate kinase